MKEEHEAKLEKRKERREAVKSAYEEKVASGSALALTLSRGPNQQEEVPEVDGSDSETDHVAEVFDDEHTTDRFGTEVVVTTTLGFDTPKEVAAPTTVDDEIAELMKTRKAELVLQKQRAVAKIQKRNLKMRIAAPRKVGLLPAKKVCCPGGGGGKHRDSVSPFSSFL